MGWGVGGASVDLPSSLSESWCVCELWRHQAHVPISLLVFVHRLSLSPYCDVVEEETSCPTEGLFYFVLSGANVKQLPSVLGHLTKQMSAFCLGLYHCVIYAGVRDKMSCLVTEVQTVSYI